MRAPDEGSIEPLFAQNARLWLRIWLVTQLVATIVATYVSVDRGISATKIVAILTAIITYHAVGLLAHRWMLRRTWAVLLYVPLSWVLVILAIEVSGAFSLLVLGAIIQGFIFLPFAWAAVTLGVVVAALAAGAGVRDRHEAPSVMLTRVGIVIATGVMIATVLLYIHRANRETALRTRLLQQLDVAQRGLADRARDAGVLEERQRLSRDIHDTLAQAFTSVIRHLEAVELALRDAGQSASLERVMPHLVHAQAVSRSSLTEIRQVLFALRPAALADASLVAALGRIVEQWGGANDVRTTFTADTLPVLVPDADVIFLRATQEALSNVARHANASNVAISIALVDGLVLLTVDDDGRGFAHTESLGSEQLGLTGMRERVRRFGGHVLIDSTLGSGTSLTVAMPLASIAAAGGAASEPAT